MFSLGIGSPSTSVKLCEAKSRTCVTAEPSTSAGGCCAYEAASFAIFARHGGRFVPTWNWRAFVFGPFWYFRRGLYGKGAVLLGLSVCPFFTLALTILLSAAVLVYCGVAGNWDDYLLKVKGTQWW